MPVAMVMGRQHSLPYNKPSIGDGDSDEASKPSLPRPSLDVFLKMVSLAVWCELLAVVAG